MAATAVDEFGAIFPKSAQVIVVISCVDRIGLIGVGAICSVRIIQKAAHTEAFVVYNAIAVATNCASSAALASFKKFSTAHKDSMCHIG